MVKDQSNVHIPNPTSVVWSIVAPAGLVGGDAANTITSTGFNGSGDATALFTANNPGAYTVQAVATFNAVQATGTQSISVNAVAASITISSSPVTLVAGSPAQTFVASVFDPFGVQLSGALVTWGGSITSGGPLSTTGPSVTTAFTPTNPGTFTLTASSVTANGNTVTANDTVTVAPAGPQFDSLTFTLGTTQKAGTANVTAHEVTPTTLTHAWTASDPSVTFSPSSETGSPVTTTVVFSNAGQFTLTDKITDGFGATASSSTVVTVSQVLSGIQVCPAGGKSCPNSITLQTLQNQQFTATGVDQFGNNMSLGSVQWTTNGGDLNASGAQASFSSSILGQPVVVTATANGRSGSITVDLVSFDVSAAYAYPVPYKANQGSGVIHFKGLGSQASLHIYTTSGRRVFDTEVASPDGTYNWPIVNSSGENVASGVYFYIIKSQSGEKDGKLIIIK